MLNVSHIEEFVSAFKVELSRAADESGAIDLQKVDGNNRGLARQLSENGSATLDEATERLESLAEQLQQQDSEKLLRGAGMKNVAYLLCRPGRDDGVLDQEEQTAFLRAVGNGTAVQLLSSVLTYNSEESSASTIAAMNAQTMATRQSKAEKRTATIRAVDDVLKDGTLQQPLKEYCRLHLSHSNSEGASYAPGLELLDAKFPGRIRYGEAMFNGVFINSRGIVSSCRSGSSSYVVSVTPAQLVDAGITAGMLRTRLAEIAEWVAASDVKTVEDRAVKLEVDLMYI